MAYKLCMEHQIKTAVEKYARGLGFDVPDDLLWFFYQDRRASGRGKSIDFIEHMITTAAKQPLRSRDVMLIAELLEKYNRPLGVAGPAPSPALWRHGDWVDAVKDMAPSSRDGPELRLSGRAAAPVAPLRRRSLPGHRGLERGGRGAHLQQSVLFLNNAVGLAQVRGMLGEAGSALLACSWPVLRDGAPRNSILRQLPAFLQVSPERFFHNFPHRSLHMKYDSASEHLDFLVAVKERCVRIPFVEGVPDDTTRLPVLLEMLLEGLLMHELATMGLCPMVSGWGVDQRSLAIVHTSYDGNAPPASDAAEVRHPSARSQRARTGSFCDSAAQCVGKVCALTQRIITEGDPAVCVGESGRKKCFLSSVLGAHCAGAGARKPTWARQMFYKDHLARPPLTGGEAPFWEFAFKGDEDDGSAYNRVLRYQKPAAHCDYSAAVLRERLVQAQQSQAHSELFYEQLKKNGAPGAETANEFARRALDELGLREPSAGDVHVVEHSELAMHGTDGGYDELAWHEEGGGDKKHGSVVFDFSNALVANRGREARDPAAGGRRRARNFELSHTLSKTTTVKHPVLELEIFLCAKTERTELTQFLEDASHGARGCEHLRAMLFRALYLHEWHQSMSSGSVLGLLLKEGQRPYSPTKSRRARAAIEARNAQAALIKERGLTARAAPSHAAAWTRRLEKKCADEQREGTVQQPPVELRAIAECLDAHRALARLLGVSDDYIISMEHPPAAVNATTLLGNILRANTLTDVNAAIERYLFTLAKSKVLLAGKLLESLKKSTALQASAPGTEVPGGEGGCTFAQISKLLRLGPYKTPDDEAFLANTYAAYQKDADESNAERFVDSVGSHLSDLSYASKQLRHLAIENDNGLWDTASEVQLHDEPTVSPARRAVSSLRKEYGGRQGDVTQQAQRILAALGLTLHRIGEESERNLNHVLTEALGHEREMPSNLRSYMDCEQSFQEFLAAAKKEIESNKEATSAQLLRLKVSDVIRQRELLILRPVDDAEFNGAATMWRNVMLRAGGCTGRALAELGIPKSASLSELDARSVQTLAYEFALSQVAANYGNLFEKLLLLFDTSGRAARCLEDLGLKQGTVLEEPSAPVHEMLRRLGVIVRAGDKISELLGPLEGAVKRWVADVAADATHVLYELGKILWNHRPPPDTEAREHSKVYEYVGSQSADVGFRRSVRGRKHAWEHVSPRTEEEPCRPPGGAFHTPPQAPRTGGNATEVKVWRIQSAGILVLWYELFLRRVQAPIGDSTDGSQHRLRASIGGRHYLQDLEAARYVRELARCIGEVCHTGIPVLQADINNCMWSPARDRVWLTELSVSRSTIQENVHDREECILATLCSLELVFLRALQDWVYLIEWFYTRLYSAGSEATPKSEDVEGATESSILKFFAREYSSARESSARERSVVDDTSLWGRIIQDLRPRGTRGLMHGNRGGRLGDARHETPETFFSVLGGHVVSLCEQHAGSLELWESNTTCVLIMEEYSEVRKYSAKAFDIKLADLHMLKQAPRHFSQNGLTNQSQEARCDADSLELQGLLQNYTRLDALDLAAPPGAKYFSQLATSLCALLKRRPHSSKPEEPNAWRESRLVVKYEEIEPEIESENESDPRESRAVPEAPERSLEEAVADATEKEEIARKLKEDWENAKLRASETTTNFEGDGADRQEIADALARRCDELKLKAERSSQTAYVARLAAIARKDFVHMATSPAQARWASFEKNSRAILSSMTNSLTALAEAWVVVVTETAEALQAAEDYAKDAAILEAATPPPKPFSASMASSVLKASEAGKVGAYKNYKEKLKVAIELRYVAGMLTRRTELARLKVAVEFATANLVRAQGESLTVNAFEEIKAAKEEAEEALKTATLTAVGVPEDQNDSTLLRNSAWLSFSNGPLGEEKLARAFETATQTAAGVPADQHESTPLRNGEKKLAKTLEREAQRGSVLRGGIFPDLQPEQLPFVVPPRAKKFREAISSERVKSKPIVKDDEDFATRPTSDSIPAPWMRDARVPYVVQTVRTEWMDHIAAALRQRDALRTAGDPLQITNVLPDTKEFCDSNACRGAGGLKIGRREPALPPPLTCLSGGGSSRNALCAQPLWASDAFKIYAYDRARGEWLEFLYAGPLLPPSYTGAMSSPNNRDVNAVDATLAACVFVAHAALLDALFILCCSETGDRGQQRRGATGSPTDDRQAEEAMASYVAAREVQLENNWGAGRSLSLPGHLPSATEILTRCFDASATSIMTRCFSAGRRYANDHDVVFGKLDLIPNRAQESGFLPFASLDAGEDPLIYRSWAFRLFGVGWLQWQK